VGKIIERGRGTKPIGSPEEYPRPTFGRSGSPHPSDQGRSSWRTLIGLAWTLPASPWRVDLLVVTYAVVIFTIVAQGLTISRFFSIGSATKAAA
jgi:hypothetical protein